jgi:hypothetical protein
MLTLGVFSVCRVNGEGYASVFYLTGRIDVDGTFVVIVLSYMDDHCERVNGPFTYEQAKEYIKAIDHGHGNVRGYIRELLES